MSIIIRKSNGTIVDDYKLLEPNEICNLDFIVTDIVDNLGHGTKYILRSNMCIIQLLCNEKVDAGTHININAEFLQVELHEDVAMYVFLESKASVINSIRMCEKDICTYNSMDWNKLEQILKEVYEVNNIKSHDINSSKCGGCLMYRIFKIKNKIIAFTSVYNFNNDKCNYAKDNIYNKVDNVIAIEQLQPDLYVLDVISNKKGNIQEFI